ncbi:MAG: hypothetical protein ACD_13C00042G0004 [uncultured bacterium]|nr:MAG: hypothetical protein ACD_13C00042G0004 [uncultured bacterium]
MAILKNCDTRYRSLRAELSQFETTGAVVNQPQKRIRMPKKTV